jgi:ElaB/YqjD/DUF883 family membrane-anchored ribosome-binding protein
MTNSHTPTQQAQRDVEDMLAVLHTVELETKTLIRRAYEFADDQSYAAANRQQAALKKFRQMLETKWTEISRKTE